MGSLFDDPMRFHDDMRTLICWVLFFGGGLMVSSIPFAIAGRGNRLLWLLISPCVVLAWSVPVALVHRSHVSFDPAILLYPTLPAVLCVSAWLFRCARAPR